MLCSFYVYGCITTVTISLSINNCTIKIIDVLKLIQTSFTSRKWQFLNWQAKKLYSLVNRKLFQEWLACSILLVKANKLFQFYNLSQYCYIYFIQLFHDNNASCSSVKLLKIRIITSQRVYTELNMPVRVVSF